MTLNKNAISAMIAGGLLALTALLGTGVMIATQHHAYPYIQYNERQVLLHNLGAVLPQGQYDNDILADSVDVRDPVLLGSAQAIRIYRARNKEKPVAAVLTVVAPNGYGGPIELLVGIHYDGVISAVRVLKHRETPGLGDGIEIQRSPWIKGFSGKSRKTPTDKNWKVRKDGGVFDQFTGATITPRAVVSAIHRCLQYYSLHRSEIFQSSKANTALAKQTIPGQS